MLALGVAVALAGSLLIVAGSSSANSADAELIGVIATITAGVVGALGGYLARGAHQDSSGATASPVVHDDTPSVPPPRSEPS